ncbi:Ureidoglycolate lyase [Teratosphaeria destructans]|uniref:Ureidoglycolate lyase n=1 Tax=Teratosphaeria destructans TaxID=418781 RepID=A0A9W7SNT2_9PEZI|nr:Ureidoglycolate lyase [Teratosphaeria destructans]
MHRTSVWSRPIQIPVEPLSPDAFKNFGQVVQDPDTHYGSPSLNVVDANQGSARKVLAVTKMRNWYELSASKKPANVSMNMFVCKPRALSSSTAGRYVFPIKILERHPFTPQTFIPMGLAKHDKSTCYLVIVAPTLPVSARDPNQGIPKAYPIPVPKRKRSLRERLLGARPNPFTNDHAPSTTPQATSPSEHRPKGPGLPDLSNIRAFIARGDQAVTYGPGTWHAPMVVLGEEPIEFVVVQFANGVGVEDCQEVDVKSDCDDEGVAVDVTAVVEQRAGPAKARL